MDDSQSNAERQLPAKQRRMLYYWFWVWPLFGVVVILLHNFNPNILTNCNQALFLPGLIGTLTSGYTIIRAKDRSFALQFVGSVVALAVGGRLFWTSNQ